MPDDIKADLETILEDLIAAYADAEALGEKWAVLRTHVEAKFRARVNRVSDWLEVQP